MYRSVTNHQSSLTSHSHSDSSKYDKAGSESQPTYLVSKCPSQYDSTQPDALLCQMHVLRPAIDPATRIWFKVDIYSKSNNNILGLTKVLPIREDL